MSYATDALLQALHYDPTRQTFTLSAAIARLGEARHALRAALGQEPVEVTNAEIVQPPPKGPKGAEVLAMQGVGDLFGHHSREIYLELVLTGGEVQSLLLLIPLPEKGWKLATGFPAVTEAPMMQGGLSLRDGVIVVSYGLSRMEGSRTVYELDRSKGADDQEAGPDEPVQREVALADYVLQDGLQIVADGLVNGSQALPAQWWQDFADATALPDQAADPARVAIRGDVADGWLDLECWWDAAAALEGIGESSSHQAGLAIHYDLQNPDEGFHYWLREISTAVEPAAEPIILEAHVVEGLTTPRYATRLGRLIPLGESLAALSSLIGAGVASQVVSALALELPDTLSLISFSYALGQGILFTVGAGDRASAEKHLLQVGPFELSEVDFTFAIPLPLTPALPIVELTGFMAVADVHFQVHARTWDLIEGAVDEPDGVHLGQFIANLLPVPLPFGLDTVTLRQARLQRLLPGEKDGEAANRLQINLDGQVDLLPGAIVLDAITLDIHKPDQGKALGSIGALLTLGPVTLSVNAERTADGWLFEGMADAPPEGLSLTKLVAHLVHAFGAAVPAEIPDVSLERISLSYDTADRRLEIQAITDWQIASDVPVLGGSASKALLQLIVARDPQQGKTHATFSVNLTLAKDVVVNGETRSYELETHALLSADAQSFGFDFDAPAGDPLTLSDVATGLGLDIPTAGAQVLDAVFQVASLSMSYARPGNAFDVAWSRPLGEGVLLAEYSQSSGSQSAPAGGSPQAGVTNRVVEVSWLGDDEDSTLGIHDVLKLAGQEHLVDDLKGLLGSDFGEIVEKIEEFLTFKQLGFSWQENDQESALLFTALSTYREAKAFVAVRGGENAGLVAGIAFAGSDDELTHADAQDLTFLPAPVSAFLKAVEEVLEHIELTHFLFSTVSSSAYQPPAFAASAMQPSYARQDGDAPSTPFGAGTMTVGRGVSVGARVKFGPHDIVRRVIAVDELDAQVTIGDVIALQVAIPGSLKLDAGAGNSLALTSPLLRIKDNLEIPEAGPEFDIQGGLDIHFFGQRLQMTGWIALAEEALTGHLQMTELALPVPLTPIYLLPGVQLVINHDKPLSLELGLQFEPPGLDLGLSGSFAIYKDDKDLVYGDAAIVLEVEGEIVQPLYVEFGTEELSIPVLLEAVTGVQYRLHQADAVAKLAAAGAEAAAAAADAVGDLAGGEVGSDVKAASEVAEQAAKGASTAIEAAESALGHLEAILSKVEFKAVRVHWADSIVNLPDGATAMPGIGIRGGLHIFDWDAFAVLDISTQGIPGFSGHLEAEKIEIGRILKIWGDGQGIRKAPTTAEDFNQQVKSKVAALAAGQQKQPTAAQDAGDWFLEPGGPVLHLSTRSSPFLHADLHAQLFGFLQTDIHADITDEGFDFDFKISAGKEVTAELECHWWHKEGKLEAHGDLGMHLHGDIGPIIPHVAATQFHLDTDLDAHVSLMVDSEEFKLTVNGSFAYQGAALHLPELVLEERFSTLAELAKKVWEHVVAEAENIFAEYLAPIGKFVAEGAKEVAQVAVAAAKEVAEVASAAAGEAKQIVSDAAETMDKAADEIGHAAENLAGEAETLASHAAQAALDAAAPLLAQAEEVGQKALQFAADAAANVEAIAQEVAALVSEAAQYAIHVAEQAAQWVAEKWDEARRWATARLEQAAVLVSQLAQAADEAVRAIEGEIAELGRQLEELLSRAVQSVEDTLSSGWHATTSWIPSPF